jgi:rubrerythrin
MPFNADEVFEMAEEIERNGAKFYRAAAKKFRILSSMLLELAAMEDEHGKTFAKMRAKLSEGEKEPLVFDPDDEAGMYLRAMADGHVFNVRIDPAQKLAGCQTAQDVLKAAIDLEKDSIAFYVGLKESVSESAGRSKVEVIIREEMGHIGILNTKLLVLR